MNTRFTQLIFSIIITFFVFQSYVYAGLLDNPIYNKMKQQFLNVNNNFISGYKINITAANLNTVLTGKNPSEFQMADSHSYGWTNYGTNYLCGDTNNPNAICRYVTGGNSSNNTPTCGQVVNTDYVIALTEKTKYCGGGSGVEEPWTGFRLWLGAGYSDDFIESLFYPKVNFSANRLCIQFEVPPNRVRYDDATIQANPELGQLVNPQVADKNLRDMRVNFGTYTSVYTSDSKTISAEMGGTFHPGGTHFYHKPESYGRYPNDKIYALNNNTFVACIGPNPSNTRSGMRPSYNINPLMTVVGDNANGKTNAYSYLNYVARLYFIVAGNKTAFAKYPVSLKFDRAWLMYEKNDIFALSGTGSVMSSKIIQAGSTAIHPFTLYNNAPEARTYRVELMAGYNLALHKVQSYFELYRDSNDNKTLDAGDVLISPNELITIPAYKSLQFIVKHTPNFNDSYQVVNSHNRKLADGSVLFLEKGRLRSASIAIRTWEGSAVDVANEKQVLSSLVYPSVNSDYEKYAVWNQDKPNNYRLIRNSPDYLMAIGKLPLPPIPQIK